jgi:8-oxo-dGTP pyrophosphatase MutT (NUDIX family)
VFEAAPGDHAELSAALDAFAPGSPAETADLARIRALVAAGDPFSRSLPLHVTCSALVVHPPSGRVLLRWHERQQSWLQVGGHVDPGETSPFAVALREAEEETGLDDLVPFPGPEPALVHVVIVPVPAGKGEPAHEHADMRYVFATDRPDAVVPESPSARLRWLRYPEARELVAPDNVRVTLARTEALAPGPVPGPPSEVEG